MKPPMIFPALPDIVRVLREHPCVKFAEWVTAGYVIGSFATGDENEESDLDILLEVTRQSDEEAAVLEDSYRDGLRQFFVTNDIRGKCDAAHPQWCGRRVDLYLEYSPQDDGRARVQLAMR